MFIEVHDEGKPMLVNIHFIESILGNNIYVVEGKFTVDENYEELKAKIELASIHNCDVRLQE